MTLKSHIIFSFVVAVFALASMQSLFAQTPAEKAQELLFSSYGLRFETTPHPSRDGEFYYSISQIKGGSDADKAGIKPGDILVNTKNNTIEWLGQWSIEQYSLNWLNAIQNSGFVVGQRSRLEWVLDANKGDKKALKKFQNPSKPDFKFPLNKQSMSVGVDLELGRKSREIRVYLVEKGSFAHALGLEKGDILLGLKPTGGFGSDMASIVKVLGNLSRGPVDYDRYIMVKRDGRRIELDIDLALANQGKSKAANAKGADYPRNPYTNRLILKSNFVGSELEAIYDGKLAELSPLPGSKRSVELAVLVFEFFRGARRGASYPESFREDCLAGADFSYKWKMDIIEKDRYGNVRSKLTRNWADIIPPQLKPLYDKYKTSLTVDDVRAHRGGYEIAKFAQCKSPTFKRMLEQVTALGLSLINGFPVSERPSDRFGLTSKLQYVRNCRALGKAIEECICRAHVSSKIYYSKRRFKESGYKPGKYLSAALKNDFRKAYQKECRNKYKLEDYSKEVRTLHESLFSKL